LDNQITKPHILIPLTKHQLPIMQLSKILNPAEPETSEPGPSELGPSAPGPSENKKCRECTQPAVKGRTLCKECWGKRSNDLRKAMRESLKKENKCYKCKADLAPDDDAQCSECLGKAKASRDQTKEEGKCADCRTEPISDDHIRCSECAEKQRAYHRSARERAKKEGNCTSCWANPAKEGMASCESCLEKWRKPAPQQ
jgi:hypothetical protein